VLAVAGAASLVLSVGLVVSPPAAIALTAAVAVLAIVARTGLLGLTMLLVGALPVMIVTFEVLPRLVGTFTAAAAVAGLAATLAPRADASRWSFVLRLGLVLFLIPIGLSLARRGTGEQLIQAAKYLVFPAMVIVITEATRLDVAPRLRAVALWSSLAAISLNLVLGLSGVANLSYYNAGEVLGLGSEHGLALLAGCTTAATLVGRPTLRTAPLTAIGAVATVATGVRSVLPGLALLVLAAMTRAGARARTIVLVGLAVAAVFLSGAAGVVESRFGTSERRGEFTSLTTAGSGRGEIYAAAIDAWSAAPAYDWVVGTGLRTIPQFSQERLGDTFVGHSDVVEVGVELGVMGLVGLALVWAALIARAPSRLPLLVLLPFAVFNGSLEYQPDLVVALVLCLAPAAAARGRAGG
jgi:hypothetical protein